MGVGSSVSRCQGRTMRFGISLERGVRVVCPAARSKGSVPRAPVSPCSRGMMCCTAPPTPPGPHGEPQHLPRAPRGRQSGGAERHPSPPPSRSASRDGGREPSPGRGAAGAGNGARAAGPVGQHGGVQGVRCCGKPGTKIWVLCPEPRPHFPRFPGCPPETRHFLRATSEACAQRQRLWLVGAGNARKISVFFKYIIAGLQVAELPHKPATHTVPLAQEKILRASRTSAGKPACSSIP